MIKAVVLLIIVFLGQGEPNVKEIPMQDLDQCLAAQKNFFQKVQEQQKAQPIKGVFQAACGVMYDVE